ncbi:type II secretion system protein GspD [Sphingomonas sp. DBB INV C78]|uniref:type II secretion system secretin GspD n=1 Tax=Sphingomonas sp. DBB INV C78 TaxID=3349434 RepID=UPI0036D2E360
MKRLILVSALALALAAPVPAQQMLNLRDADIRAFIQDAARVTGRTFIIDPRVQGKVSVVTDRPLSRAEYLEVFLSTLRANGLVAVPTSGGSFRVQPLDTAAAQPGSVGARGASNNSFVTEVFRLQTIDAASAMETIRPLVSREGSVTANRTGNAVVVADFADNIRRIRDLLTRIDRDSSTTRVVALRNAGAREIAQSLQQLVGGRGGGEGAAATAGPGVSVVAIDSSNSIALRGDPSTVARLSQIAEELDRRAASGSEIRVIFLQHADAGQLLPVLQQIVGQPVTPASSGSSRSSSRGMNGGNGGSNNGGGNGGGGDVSVAPAQASSAPVGRGQPVIARFEGANAIVIAATSDMQRTLGEVIRQLDTRREQVLVEAIIVEISDNAARKLGVQFLLGGVEGSAIPFAATNYSNTAPNLLTIAGAVAAQNNAPSVTTVAPDGTKTTVQGSSDLADQLAQAAVSSILGAGGGFFGIGGQTDNGVVFGAIINAVQNDTESNILSTPSVLTLDNQEAKLLVGQEIPVTTGESLSDNFDNAFRTVQRQNVGIQLEVKPQINAGGAIKLFLRQEVSSVAGPVSNDNSELILNKREIETTVTVDDGEIIALGGLLDDNERKTIERIPLLSDIPVIGELFKSRSRSRVKTNLMVFIRPRILRSVEDARALATQRYGYIRGMQAAQQPEYEPSIDELVRDYMGATPPIPASPAIGSNMPAPEPGTAPQIITPSMKSSSEVIRPVPMPDSKKQKFKEGE